MPAKKNKSWSPKSDSSSKKFAIDVSWAFLSMVISLVAGIVLRIILGNYFGPEGLGLFSIVFILVAIAGVVGDFGVPAALVKFLSQHQKNKEKVDKLISCSIINAFFLGLALTFFFFIFSDYIAILFGMPELSLLLKIVSIMFPFLIINDIFTGIYNGFRWMNKYTYFIILKRGGLLIIAWILILFGLNVIAAIIAMVLKEIVVFFYNIITTRNIGIKLQFKDHITESKKMFSFSKYLFFTDQIDYFNTNLDMFVIGVFLTDKDVGIYAVAVMIMRLFLTIPEAISRIMFPMTSELHGKKDHKRIEKAINLIMRYSFIIASILGLTIIFLGKLILRILYPAHPEFGDAYIPLVILLIGAITSSIFYSFRGLFTAFDKPEIPFRITVATTFLNFCLNITLIPIYGIAGGAVATSITFISGAILTYYLFRKLSEIKLMVKWLIIGFSLFLTIIILYFVFITLINQYLLMMILFPIFIIMVYYKNIFTKNDIRYLIGIIRSLLRSIFKKKK